MKTEKMQSGPAWQLGCQKVAGQLGVDDNELRSKLIEYHRKRMRNIKIRRPRWKSIKNKRNQNALARRVSWQLHPEMFENILKIIFLHDPIGMCDHKLGASEYCPEVNTILPRLSNSQTIDEIQQIFLEEFTHWFGPTGKRCADRYIPIAKEIWGLIQEQK